MKNKFLMPKQVFYLKARGSRRQPCRASWKTNNRA